MESRPAKRKRGPYRKYQYDPNCPVPRTTQWRSKKAAAFCSKSFDHEFPSDGSDGNLRDGRVLSDDAFCDSGDSRDGDVDSGDDVFVGNINVTGGNGDVNDDGDAGGNGDVEGDGDADGNGDVEGDGDADGNGDVEGDGDMDGDHVFSDSDTFSDDDMFSDIDVSDDAGDDNDAGGDGHVSTEDGDGTSKSKKSNSYMSERIYPGSQVTVLEAYCLLMELKRICRLSFTTMVTLLSLLQILCPAGNLLPTSKHQLLKFAYQFKCKHSRIDYCRSCGGELANSSRCPSDTCRKEEPNSILLFSPNQAIQRIIRDNWKKVKTHALTKQGIVGVVINTDGISPFKSSPLNIWPIFLSIWNLPPEIRMLKQNIVACMFWIGNCKPNMTVFLSMFKKSLDEANIGGLMVATCEGTISLMLKPILGVFDMVAKAPILNINQFNGKHGCPSCLHPGERIAFAQTYPPGTVYPARSTQSLQKAAEQAERSGKIVEGVKGSSILASILDLPIGAPIDYMHCVLEGVAKRLLDKWVTSPRQPFYIGKQSLKLLDQRFVIQQPPHEFTRAPRSIEKHRKYWKASEYRTWLLFYSLPLLLGILPPLYVHHLALLVCALHILLQPNITTAQINAAEVMLKDFVSLVPDLYDKNECTINMHLLLHLADHARTWGPLWGYSAFPFEHKNGYIMSHIHSPYRIAGQIMFSFNLSQTLDTVQEELSKTASEEVLSFLQLSGAHSHSNQLTCGAYVVGPMCNLAIDSETKDLISGLADECPSHVMSFSRVYHHGVLLHSVEFGRPDNKRDSTVCSYVSNGKEHCGIIQAFLLIKNDVIILVKPFTSSGSLLQTAGIPGRTALQRYARSDLLATFVVQVKKELTLPIMAVALEQLTYKCIRVHQPSEPYDFVIKMPNSFECH